MRQKFCILRDLKTKALIIQEYAVIDGGASGRESGGPEEGFSLLCQQAYSAEAVQSAIPKGKHALVSLLRNRNFFPIGLYMDQIAQAVSGLFEDAPAGRSMDLIFDDADHLSRAPDAPDLGGGVPADVEDLFEDPEDGEPRLNEASAEEDSSEDLEEE